MTDWLTIRRGQAALVLTVPHAGTWIPDSLAERFTSLWQARKDADWYIDALYACALELDVTMITTAVSRSVIDVNRDPGGSSLYPGQATTGLCPVTDFDGHSLYRLRQEPHASEVIERREMYFDPYHVAIESELTRLRAHHPRVIVYDAHSIRSHVPRLFEGALPLFNIGTNLGLTCDPALSTAVAARCAASGESWVLDGRFRGGWTTRHYGRPAEGLHAVQMELAMRGYLAEPVTYDPKSWPASYDPVRSQPLRLILRTVLETCLERTTT